MRQEEKREDMRWKGTRRDKKRYWREEKKTRRDEKKTFKVRWRTLQFPSSSAFTIILPQFFPGMPLKKEKWQQWSWHLQLQKHTTLTNNENGSNPTKGRPWHLTLQLKPGGLILNDKTLLWILVSNKRVNECMNLSFINKWVFADRWMHECFLCSYIRQNSRSPRRNWI